MLTLSLPRDLPAHPGDPVVFEPAQLVNVPLVEAIDGDIAEERVAGALGGGTGGRLKPMLSEIVFNLHNQISSVVRNQVYTPLPGKAVRKSNSQGCTATQKSCCETM